MKMNRLEILRNEISEIGKLTSILEKEDVIDQMLLDRNSRRIEEIELELKKSIQRIEKDRSHIRLAE